MSLLMQLNYTLFQSINGLAGIYPWLDALMVFCANYLVFCLPLVMLLMWGRPLAWRRQQLSSGEQEILRERRAAVLWVAIACLVAYAMNLLIEQVIFEPRPFITHHVVHQLITHAADGSFPSDHTAWAFAVGGMFLLQLLPARKMARLQKRETGESTLLKALNYPAWITLLTFAVGCAIGFARVFVGVHYPGDILGGAFDGLIAAIVITLIRVLLSKPTNAILRFAGNMRLT